MAYWLFKEEPEHYSFANLERDGWARWDGVENNLALRHLRQIRKGDNLFYYHTGKEKAIVGIMEAVSDPYEDPKAKDSRLVAIDVKPISRLPRPVTLAEIKGDAFFWDWELVRLARLSVMPVSKEQWKRIEAMSRGDSS